MKIKEENFSIENLRIRWWFFGRGIFGMVVCGLELKFYRCFLSFCWFFFKLFMKLYGDGLFLGDFRRVGGIGVEGII